MKKHEIVEQVKLLQSVYLEDLEKQINRFKKEHKVKNLEVKTGVLNQRGVMICDRQGDGRNELTIYIATIVFDKDFTEEKANEKLIRWLSAEYEKLKKSCGHYTLSFDVVTQEDFARRKKESGDVAKMYKKFEDEFSIEDGQ